MLNLSKKIKSRRAVALKTATLHDNNPICTALDPSNLPVHCDSEERDICKEGRNDIMIVSSINAVDIHWISWSPTTDVWAKPVDDLQDDDPDVMRAQVDAGAHESCTDQKHVLHSYREFTPSRPSPVKLIPATVNSDAVPKGVGYCCVPAMNAQGFLPVQTFYIPSLCTALIDEMDLVKFAKMQVKDTQSDSITKHKDTNTFTCHAKHCKSSSKDVIAHGILIHNKCYTGALILPDLCPTDGNGIPSASSILAMERDPEFAEQCCKATVLAIHGYHEAAETQLGIEMAKLPVQFHKLPFHEHIQAKTPVSTIKAATERLLWHQHLRCPSNYSLFNAHWHADGVPRFPHVDHFLDICPTCIRSKQTKTAASCNTTMTVKQPCQGLSIDFSFSGTW